MKPENYKKIAEMIKKVRKSFEIYKETYRAIPPEAMIEELERKLADYFEEEDKKELDLKIEIFKREGKIYHYSPFIRKQFLKDCGVL